MRNVAKFLPMTPTPPVTAPEPILRTLSPLLASLATQLRRLLDSPRVLPWDSVQQATLQGILGDLERKAQDLARDEPVLIIMLMGGTGVGKSTLLNALAGTAIASASALRPTTREPVVYCHESVSVERLDPALRACRLERHRRETLRQKVIVDTPDLDSTDLANRETLKAILPIADIVLYVGSQEKYHDRLGWDLFRQEKRRRAFAFVLNKWDRCSQTGTSGRRPDEDLLTDLRREGFDKPLLFRVNARAWAEGADGTPTTPLPEGEQFPELTEWLETGLSQLEIEAVKARGVIQLLDHLQQYLLRVRPPDLSTPAKRTLEAWRRVLRQQAADDAELLIHSLDPMQLVIERHFRRQMLQEFKGLMLWSFKLYHGIQDWGGHLGTWFRVLPKVAKHRLVNDTWDLTVVTRECIRAAKERAWDERLKGLGNRLLMEAEKEGFPISLLHEPIAKVATMDWQERLHDAVSEAMRLVEQICVRPTGFQRVQHALLIRLGNVIPVLTFFGGYLLVMYRFYVERIPPAMPDLFAPAFFALLSLVLVHAITDWLLPLNWRTIRGHFREQLTEFLRVAFETEYRMIPETVTEKIDRERREIEDLCQEATKAREWLAGRENALRIAALYGRIEKPTDN